MITTGLAALGLFLSRYIGIFAIGMMWVMCGYLVLVQKKLEACIKLICISLAILSIESAYLYNNWIQTGYITGIDRVAAPETNMELLNAFTSAVWLEMLFTISDYTGRNSTLLLIGLITAQLIFFIYCIDLIWKAIRVGSFKIDHTSIMFFLIGSSYFLAITTLRWISDFDHFNYRLFAPATLLILIGITRTVELSCTEKYFSRYSIAIALAAITSIVISTYDINFVYQFTRY